MLVFPLAALALLPRLNAEPMTFPEEEEVRRDAAEAELLRVIRERGDKLVALLRSVTDAESAKKHAAEIREYLLWELSPEQTEQVDEELIATAYLDTFTQIVAELERLIALRFYDEPSLLELLPCPVEGSDSHDATAE